MDTHKLQPYSHDSETAPKGYFFPRILEEGKLQPWVNKTPKQPAVIIQSAIRGGGAFEPAKTWELEQLKTIDPEIIGVHSYAGPFAPEQIIDSASEDASIAHIVNNLLEANRRGWKGVVIIDCMADPALLESRKILTNLSSGLKIVGPAETSMRFLAKNVGSFAVVDISQPDSTFPRLAERYGLKNNLMGVYNVESLEPIDVSRLDLKMTATLIYEQIQKAQNDGAKGIVFGCTTLSGILSYIQMSYPSLCDFPVIEPMSIALKEAVGKIKQGSS